MLQWTSTGEPLERLSKIIFLYLSIASLLSLTFGASQEFCAHFELQDESILSRFKRAAGIERLWQGGRSITHRQHQPSQPNPAKHQQSVYHQVEIDGRNPGQIRQDRRPVASGLATQNECPKKVVGKTGSDKTRLGSYDENCTSIAPTNNNASSIKIIETAVFIDQALDSKFNGLSGGLVELNKLVLTIMNQVQYLFKYSSMKVPIRLKLVLVEHLKNSGNQIPNPERGDIDAYLGNFCNWQQSRLEREKRLWWDHAILLSGLDLYKVTPDKNHTGVLGLAWVGGMCKGNYSCTINEASNLESAFVIAHEVGHSLGILHDGQKNSCDPNGFIMSERTGAGKVHWSRCSINYINDSINRRQLSCLDIEQSTISDPLYDLSKLKLPGQVYSLSEQCRLAFGSNYTSFMTRQQPFNAVCRELWCVSGTWAKAAHPALEGSSCGDQDRICREGKCVLAESRGLQ